MISSPIEEIKSRLDIVEVISSYIKLQKAGANYRALCPFHSEKKSSFFVSPARQIWHCFGCNSGGDIFRFVMQIEGVEFGDALRMLAQRAGVELKPIKKELITERQRLYEICELAAQFFEKQLESKTGQEVKKYLSNRGVSEESIKKWRLGYSPDLWQGLSDFLTSKNYKREEIEKAGLAIKNEEGKFYDRFRGRVIFPVFDLSSQVVGFGGRIFGEEKKSEKGIEEAKYINTPSTLLYDKSRVLYGLDKAKLAIRKNDFCILVEGYTDVILASQAGYENVVATSGTALTPYQLKILKRYSENLYTSFDMDIAGDSATKRGIDLAQTQGFNIKVIVLPEDLDPADVISKNPQGFGELIKNSLSILEFYFKNTFSRFDKKTPDGKKSISKILLPVIKRIPNQIEQSFWIQRLAKELEVKEENVVEELKKIKLEEDVYGLEPEEIINLPPKSRRELLGEKICMHVARSSENFQRLTNEYFNFLDTQTCQIIGAFKDNPIEKGKPQEQASKIKVGFPSETASHIDYLLLRSEVEDESDGEDKKTDYEICLKEIRLLGIKNKLNELSRDIKRAEEEKKEPEIEKLVREFDLCSKKLQDLDNIK
jgi:DNA primase